MAKLRFLILLGFLLTFSQSCINDLNPNYLEFYWEQTGCADPWAGESINSEAKISEALVAYLKDEGIKGAKVKDFKSDGVEAVCLACTCTTGVKIYVEVPKTSKNKMLELGFKEA